MSILRQYDEYVWVGDIHLCKGHFLIYNLGFTLSYFYYRDPTQNLLCLAFQFYIVGSKINFTMNKVKRNVRILKLFSILQFIFELKFSQNLLKK